MSATDSLSCKSLYVAFPEQIIPFMAGEMLAVDTSLAGRASSSMKGYFTLRRSLKN